MTADDLFFLVSRYGVTTLGVATYLSCLALPVPSSMFMLAAGAFVASGDLDLWAAFGAAVTGAVAGDQTGYMIGRTGGTRLIERMSHRPKVRSLLDRAGQLTRRFGGGAVFLSRWLFSPLGPHVNFLAGAARMTWARFTIWDIAGETVWVTLYLSLGYVFSSQVTIVAGITANAVGFFAASAIAVILLLLLRERINRHRRRTGND